MQNDSKNEIIDKELLSKLEQKLTQKQQQSNKIKQQLIQYWKKVLQQQIKLTKNSEEQVKQYRKKCTEFNQYKQKLNAQIEKNNIFRSNIDSINQKEEQNLKLISQLLIEKQLLENELKLSNIKLNQRRKVSIKDENILQLMENDQQFLKLLIKIYDLVEAGDPLSHVADESISSSNSISNNSKSILKYLQSKFIFKGISNQNSLPIIYQQTLKWDDFLKLIINAGKNLQQKYLHCLIKLNQKSEQLDRLQKFNNKLDLTSYDIKNKLNLFPSCSKCLPPQFPFQQSLLSAQFQALQSRVRVLQTENKDLRQCIEGLANCKCNLNNPEDIQSSLKVLVNRLTQEREQSGIRLNKQEVDLSKARTVIETLTIKKETLQTELKHKEDNLTALAFKVLKYEHQLNMLNNNDSSESDSLSENTSQIQSQLLPIRVERPLIIQRFARYTPLNYIRNKLPEYLRTRVTFNQDKEIELLFHHDCKLNMYEFIKYQWKNLRKLYIYNCGITDKDWVTFIENADAFPNLTQIFIHSNKIKTVRQGDLQKLVRLKAIYFSWISGTNPLSQQSKQIIKKFFDQNSDITVYFKESKNCCIY